MKAKRREIPTLSAADIGVDEARIGLSGSPTKVHKIFTPPQRTQGEIFKEEEAQANVDKLMEKLIARKVI